MYSLKRRLLLVLIAGFVLVIAGAGLCVEHILHTSMTAEVDATLLAKARYLRALIEIEDGKVVFDYEPGDIPEFVREEDPEYFQIWLDDGRVLFRSKRLGAEDLGRDGATSYDGSLPGGRAGRLVRLTFAPGVDDDDDARSATAPPQPGTFKPSDRAPAEMRSLTLVVAKGRDRLDALIGRTRTTLLGMGGLAMVIGALFVWRSLVVGFRPVDQIVAQVRTLDAERLTSRVNLTRTPRELAPIVVQLNALLERLAAAFQRERRFTANVAHELRTPIAELRSLSDVAARWPDDAALMKQFFGDVGDIASNMETVITDLLLLARCQAGVERATRSPVELLDAVRAAWSRLERDAEARDLRLALEVPDDLVVESDPGKLAIILSNVLGNAVSYASPGTEIRCAAHRSGQGFRLEIANAAKRLDAGDLERLAEPFWRKDEARSSGGHAGLGLSVVTAVAELLGHDVTFAQDQNGTFRVSLEGPAHARDALPA